MSEPATAEASETETTATTETSTTETATETQPKPAETVDFWKQKAREQEKRAKENAAAAQELTRIKEANKTEAEKVADRIAVAESTVAQLPMMVADHLKTHLVNLHKIPADDAELFLTATDPELLLRQVDRLLERDTERRAKEKKQGNHVAREGTTTSPEPNDERAAVQAIFGGGG